jgi:hypothetical protein
MLYNFALRDVDGISREKNGQIELENDGAAHDFGKLVILDMIFGNKVRYEGWTMEVASGERFVCSLPFPS